MMEHKKWVDVVKGFAIIAVVLFHSTYRFSQVELLGGAIPVRQLLGTFWHVPVFLCVGGFFLKDDQLRKPIPFIKKKWKQLYVKLLVFYGIFILFHNLFFEIGFYNEDHLYNNRQILRYLTLTDYAKATLWALFAAREPFLGAMWFVNLLFLGLVILSVLSFAISKKVQLARKEYEYFRALLVLCLCCYSCVLTHYYKTSIIRITPSLCAVSLIYCGYIINNRLHIQFNNRYVFIGALLIVYELSLLYGDTSLANDVYDNSVTLVAGSVCSLYVLAYVAKRIENTIGGKVIAYCGKKSYFIMALHLLGFKLATAILACFNIPKPLYEIHSPANNIPELILYVFCGILFSLCIDRVYVQVKQFVAVKQKMH